MNQSNEKSSGLLGLVRDELLKKGIDLDAIGCGDINDAAVKVVCLASDLGQSIEEMGQSTRDQVVMVRIDEETCSAIDAWIEAGAIKSRSEGAALFIREGLKVRASELEKLKGALKDVENAKDRLKKKAKQIFGDNE